MSTSAIEHATLPDEPHLVTYADGVLAWTSNDGKGKDSAGRLRDDEIIFVLPPSGGRDHYLVTSLTQASQDDAGQSFQLSTLAARTLPQDIFDRHLLRNTPEHFKGELYVIVSVKSGTNLAQGFFDTVLEPLLEILGLAGASSTEGKKYTVVATEDAQTVRRFAQEKWGGADAAASGHNSQTVVLLSGDGGVVDLLNGSSAPVSGPSHPTLALLPLGTGNALFHSLHRPFYASTDGPVPSPFVLGLRTLFRGSPAPLPTFVASFSAGSQLISYSPVSESTQSPPEEASLEEKHNGVDRLFGAVVASYGFHSQLVWESDTPEYRKHGAKRFGMVAQELLKESHAYHADVEVRHPGDEDGFKKLDRARFNYVLATMISNLEKTFTISPASRPLDGQLRLVHFGDVGGDKTMEIMMAAYNDGSHVGMEWTGAGAGGDGDGRETVGYEEVEEIRVTTLEADARWRKVCVDGTIVEVPRGGSVTVKKVAQPWFRVLSSTLP